MNTSYISRMASICMAASLAAGSVGAQSPAAFQQPAAER